MYEPLVVPRAIAGLAPISGLTAQPALDARRKETRPVTGARRASNRAIAAAM